MVLWGKKGFDGKIMVCWEKKWLDDGPVYLSERLYSKKNGLIGNKMVCRKKMVCGVKKWWDNSCVCFLQRITPPKNGWMMVC